MKAFLVPFLFVPTLAFAEGTTQSVVFTSSSAERDYGVFIVAAPSACPATRFEVVGDGIQAVSEELLAGQSAVLPLGRGFSPGEHGFDVTSIGCAASVESMHLIDVNKSSPGHGRATVLTGVDLVRAPSD